jgi:hypothetical protein
MVWQTQGARILDLEGGVMSYPIHTLEFKNEAVPQVVERGYTVDVVRRGPP